MRIRLPAGTNTRRLVCALPLVMWSVGCGSADEQGTPRATADSARVLAPAGADTADHASTASALAPEAVLRVAVEQLLRGPGDSAATQSWFSSATAGALRTVSVDSAGHATVDFENLQALIPNASSSAGSTMLLDELNAAVFTVDAVRSVDYLIEGDCERFWGWLQYSCQTVRRP